MPKGISSLENLIQIVYVYVQALFHTGVAANDGAVTFFFVRSWGHKYLFRVEQILIF